MKLSKTKSRKMLAHNDSKYVKHNSQKYCLQLRQSPKCSLCNLFCRSILQNIMI